MVFICSKEMLDSVASSTGEAELWWQILFLYYPTFLFFSSPISFPSSNSFVLSFLIDEQATQNSNNNKKAKGELCHFCWLYCCSFLKIPSTLLSGLYNEWTQMLPHNTVHWSKLLVFSWAPARIRIRCSKLPKNYFYIWHFKFYNFLKAYACCRILNEVQGIQKCKRMGKKMPFYKKM